MSAFTLLHFLSTVFLLPLIGFQSVSSSIRSGEFSLSNVDSTVLDLLLPSPASTQRSSELRMESWAPNSASSEERFAVPSEDVAVKVCYLPVFAEKLNYSSG